MREREQEAEEQDRPLRGPPQPLHDRLHPDGVADPAREVRTEDEQAEDEHEREEHQEDHREAGQAPLDEAAGLLPVVRRVERPHQRVHRAGERPEREDRPDDDHREARARLRLGDTVQAVSEEGQRLLRRDSFESLDDRRHRVLVGDEAEDPDGHEHQRGDRQEGVVRERRREVGDVVLDGPLAGADEDRQVVVLREVGRRRVGQTGLVVLGLRLQHLLSAVPAGCLLLGHRLQTDRSPISGRQTARSE